MSTGENYDAIAVQFLPADTTVYKTLYVNAKTKGCAVEVLRAHYDNTSTIDVQLAIMKSGSTTPVPLYTATVAASAGTADGTVPTLLTSSTKIGAVDAYGRYTLRLGPGDALQMQCKANVATNKTLSITGGVIHA